MGRSRPDGVVVSHGKDATVEVDGGGSGAVVGLDVDEHVGVGRKVLVAVGAVDLRRGWEELQGQLTMNILVLGICWLRTWLVWRVNLTWFESEMSL